MNPIYWPWPALITTTIGLWVFFTTAVYLINRRISWDPSILLCATGTAVAVFLPFAVIASIKSDRAYQVWCQRQEPGAHVETHTDTTTVTTVDAKGGVGVGTGASVTYYCLSADGRILDIS